MYTSQASHRVLPPDQRPLRAREKMEIEPVPVDRILQEVARVYSVRVFDMKSDRRSPPWLAESRQVAYHLCRELTLHSFPAIARIMRRDHSTLVYGDDKIRRLRLANPEMETKVSAIITTLTAGETHEPEPVQ